MVSRLKIFGMCVLLSGMAMARPQAQIQTGTTNARPPLSDANTPQTSAVPRKLAANNGAAKQPASAKPSAANASNGTFRPLSPAAAKAVAKDTAPPSAQPVVPQPQGQIQTPSPVLEPPKRPSELPPVQPKILFQNGLLTVQAPNSTLSDILNGIRTKAGIQFEGAQGAVERVAANFGPAPANEVLTDLLRGSRFDYVILGANDGTDFVQKVILTPRAGTNAPAPVVAAAPGQPQPQPKPPDAPSEGEEDNSGNDEQANAPAEVVQPQPQPQPQAQPAEQQPSDQPKTTEQLLQELKQMQQQQQLQQGQQPNQEASPLKPGAPIQPNSPNTPPVRPRVPQ
jgi:hypothetical protein